MKRIGILVMLCCLAGCGSGGSSSPTPVAATVSSTPVLSALTTSPPTLQYQNGATFGTLTVQFNFTDADADITTLQLSNLMSNNNTIINGGTIDISNNSTVQNRASGTASVQFQVPTGVMGTITSNISLIDRTGKISNSMPFSYIVQ
jgi:hypothetical protein